LDNATPEWRDRQKQIAEMASRISRSVANAITGTGSSGVPIPGIKARLACSMIGLGGGGPHERLLPGGRMHFKMNRYHQYREACDTGAKARRSYEGSRQLRARPNHRCVAMPTDVPVFRRRAVPAGRRDQGRQPAALLEHIFPGRRGRRRTSWLEARAFHHMLGGRPIPAVSTTRSSSPCGPFLVSTHSCAVSGKAQR